MKLNYIQQLQQKNKSKSYNAHHCSDRGGLQNRYNLDGEEKEKRKLLLFPIFEISVVIEN